MDGVCFLLVPQKGATSCKKPETNKSLYAKFQRLLFALKTAFFCTATNVKKMPIYCSALPMLTYKIWTLHGISSLCGHCIILPHDPAFRVYCQSWIPVLGHEMPATHRQIYSSQFRDGERRVRAGTNPEALSLYELHWKKRHSTDKAILGLVKLMAQFKSPECMV